MSLPREKQFAPSPSAAIAGLGHYLPEHVVPNNHFAQNLETTDEWIVSRTGIRTRRRAKAAQATSDLALHAAEAALKNAGRTADQIDLILLGTATPDMPVPSTACRLQAALCAHHAAAMDIGAGCCGFLFVSHLASVCIRSGAYRCVLAVGAETMTRFLDERCRQTSVLFGDGAGAAVISTDGWLELIYSAISSNGDHADLIQIPAGGSREPASAESVASRRHCVQMKGKEVFRLAVRDMVAAAKDALSSTGLAIADFAQVIPHQANARIVEAIAEQLGLEERQVVLDMADTGNTSAASIPIALSRLSLNSGIHGGRHVMLLGFGAGTTGGCQIARVRRNGGHSAERTAMDQAPQRQPSR